jgi:hypothetical protein
MQSERFGMGLIPVTCDPAEVSRIEQELANPHTKINIGVGILDLQAGVIRIFTYDETDAFSRANLPLQVMAGHEAAAAMAGVPLDQARGFAVSKLGGAWQVFNQSHLNRPDGQPNTMQMSPLTFTEILAALQSAGIHNPAVP